MNDQLPREVSVGRRVAHGFAWSITNGIFERGLTAVSQLVLAYFLHKRDFGLLALTYTVTSLSSLLQQFGIKQALIQRGDDFERWATPAHWMSVSVGLVAAFVTIAAAPIAAAYYRESQLIGLLTVAAIGFPAGAFSAVPEAKLSLEMRFRFIAKLAMIGTVLTFCLGLLFAGLFRWGAYSIIVPPVIVSLARLPFLWLFSGAKIRVEARIKDWPALFSTSATLLVASIIGIATYAGPMSILGRLTGSTDLVGAFYFMHQLSDQPVRLLVANLAAVMLPALANLHGNPEQQIHGFSRAVRGILLVGVPICTIQAVVSGAVVRLLLPDKYHSSSWLLSLLSLYMIGRLVFPLIENMLTAQRRQRTWLAISIGYVPVFLIACVVGVKLAHHVVLITIGNVTYSLGPSEACAVAMTICFYGVIPIGLAKCFDPLGPSARIVWQTVKFPVFAGAFSAVCGAIVVSVLPSNHMGDILKLIIGSSLIGGIYYLLSRKFAARDLNDLLVRIGEIAPNRVRGVLTKLRNGLV